MLSPAVALQFADIVDAVRDAKPLPAPTGLEEWLKKRGAAPAASMPQHGIGASAAPGTAGREVAAAAASPRLAAVPIAVPELPDVMSERVEMMATMRDHLVGAAGSSGTVSLSSVKRKKISAHGQVRAACTHLQFVHPLMYHTACTKRHTNPHIAPASA